METKRRLVLISLLSLGFLAASHVLAAPVASIGEVAGQPTMGATGKTETVADIMRRQALLPPDELNEQEDDDVVWPDRTHLPQNPASPSVSQSPELPADLKSLPGGGPSFSPQVVGTNFTAATLSGTNPTSAYPPDCMGTVGPTQYFVAVNGRLVTFNKTTGVADGVINATTNAFFTSVRNGSGTSDPRIRYDRLTGRWFLVIINVSTPNRILLAVSDAASAGVISAGTVFTYFYIPIDSTPPAISSTCLADYPTLGLDANALYLGTNNFCGSPSQTFNSTDGYVVRKSSVLGAGPLVVTVFRGLVPTSSSVGPYTPQGVDNPDVGSTEGYFIGVDNVSYGLLQMRRVSTPGGTPTISANISLTVPTTGAPITVPHLGNTLGTSAKLDPLDDRLFAAHVRNGKLWTSHNIQVNSSGVYNASGGRDGSRWYEFSVPVGSGTPTLLESGTVFDPTATNPRSYWIPSVMVSGQGHAAFALSSAGNADRANAATVGRLVGDALGTTQTVALYTSSSTAYNVSDGYASRGAHRWGDYSYVSLDPIDDQTMWAVHMFCDATNSYGVRVAKLIAPPPATPSTLADVTAGQNPVSVTLTGVSTSGSGFWDPGTNLSGVPAFNHLAVSITNGSATGTPPSVVSATFVNATTINLVLNAASATANIGTEKYTLTATNPDGQTAAAAVVHVVGGVVTGACCNPNTGGCTVTTQADCPTPNWLKASKPPTFSRASRRRTSSASCRHSSAKATSSGSWATASTTPPRSAPPMSASPSITPSISPRNRPMSSCWKRA